MRSLLALLIPLIATACGEAPRESTEPTAAPVATSEPASDAEPDAKVDTDLPIIGDPRPAPFVDERVAPILAEFLADAEARGVELPEVTTAARVIKFVPELNSSAPGTDFTMAWCEPKGARDALGNTIRWKEISIVEPANTPLAREGVDYTADADNFNLRRIVYHELGHCLLGKTHGGSSLTSLMAAHYIPLKPAAGAWDDMVDELFEGER